MELIDIGFGDADKKTKGIYAVLRELMFDANGNAFQNKFVQKW